MSATPSWTIELREHDPVALQWWYGLEDFASVSSLSLELQQVWPEPERLAEFIAPEHLPALRELDLAVKSPLPRIVWESLARHRGLELVWLSGGCIGDVPLEIIGRRAELGSLRELRLFFGRLSHEGVEALCRASFAASLEVLWLWGNGLDARGLEALCAGSWPRLRELDLSYLHVDTHTRLVETRFAALGDGLRPGIADDTPPTDPQHALEQRLRERLQSGDPISPDTLSSLIECIDDERFEQVYLHDCQAAMAGLRDGPFLSQLRPDRPQALAFDAVRVDFQFSGDASAIRAPARPLHASHLSIHTRDVDALAGVDWLRAFPRLRSLRLEACPRAWRALERVLPTSLVELDLRPCACTWLDEDADLHYLKRMLSTRPTIERVQLGSGWWTDPGYRHEVEWAFGSHVVDGWLALYSPSASRPSRSGGHQK